MKKYRFLSPAVLLRQMWIRGCEVSRSRRRVVTLVIAFQFMLLGGLLSACGGSSAPRVTDSQVALSWINEYMSAGYTLYNSNGDPMGSTGTCSDANGQWIAGCVAFYYMNAKSIAGPAESDWSYWQANSVFDYGDGSPRVRTQCFGLIPPYDNYDTQLYEVSCDNTSRPPN